MKLEQAIALACEAHCDQKDKAGEPYILHALRVMTRLWCDAYRLDTQMAGVLHDALEDGEDGMVRLELKALGASPGLLKALELLTHQPKDTYDEYIAKVAQDDIARTVKLADLRDNMDEDRLGLLEPSEAARLRTKYQRAKAQIIHVIAEKNARLYPGMVPQ